MIRERPAPPGTMDSTTVNEVNSYCAKIGASDRASNTMERKIEEKRGVGMF